MLKKIVIALACAAAFTAVFAQWGWGDSDPSSSTSSSPWDDSVESTLSEPTSPSSSADAYDIGSGSSSDGSFSSAFGGTDESAAPAAAEPAAEKTRRERAQRAPRAPRERAGSSTFAGPQKTCPVCTSVRLKNNLYTVAGGKRIHVCSDACLHRVRRNPAPFAAKIEKRGEQLAGQ